MRLRKRASAAFLDFKCDLHDRAVFRDLPVFNPGGLSYDLQASDTTDCLMGIFNGIASRILPVVLRGADLFDHFDGCHVLLRF
jgi:hypothetical protein